MGFRKGNLSEAFIMLSPSALGFWLELKTRPRVAGTMGLTHVL